MPKFPYFRVTDPISNASYDMVERWYDRLVALGHQVFIDEKKRADGWKTYQVWRFGEGATSADNQERCKGVVVKATSRKIMAMFKGNEEAV